VSKPNIAVYVTLHSPFFESTYCIQFLLSTNYLTPVFTWIAVGAVDLRFPLLLLTKASAVEEETK